MDAFTQGYFEAMEFTDCHDDAPEMRDADGFAPELIAKAEADCARFQHEQAVDLAAAEATDPNQDAARSGVDFWLTRNHHGAGFWDRGLGVIGDRLTAAAHAYGECELYVGDDNMIY